MPHASAAPAALFCNRRAGNRATHRFRDQIRKTVRTAFPLIPQFDMDSDESVVEGVRIMIARGIGAVAVLGGDGSMHRFLTIAIPLYEAAGLPLPIIIRLKCGHVNFGDHEMGVIGPDPIRTLVSILHAMSLGLSINVVEYPVLQINDLIGFAYGNAIVAELMARYEHGRTPGEYLGVRKVAKVVGRMCVEELFAATLTHRRPSVMAPFHAELTFVGEEGTPFVVPTDTYTGMIASTAASVGMHLYPTYRARERSGHFHFVGVRNGFWGLAANLPKLVIGSPLSGDPVDRLATKVTIRYVGRRPPIMIDGDVYAADRLPPFDVVRVWQHRLRFGRSVA